MFCVPIIASDTEEAVSKVAAAGRVADVLEVRLDLMDSFDIRRIVRAAEKPVLVTYRSLREGGKGKDKPEQVAGYLLSAVEAGADLVDVELSMSPEIRNMIIGAPGKAEIVISTHVTKETPSDDALEKIYNDSIAAGGDIIKIVTMARQWEDNLRMLGLVSRAKRDKVRIISFCMGAIGRMSRVFSVHMGACMTFASLGPGQESANGQIDIHKMKEIAGYFAT